jgi:hypothetical protein
MENNHLWVLKVGAYGIFFVALECKRSAGYNSWLIVICIHGRRFSGMTEGCLLPVLPAPVLPSSPPAAFHTYTKCCFLGYMVSTPMPCLYPSFPPTQQTDSGSTHDCDWGLIWDVDYTIILVECFSHSCWRGGIRVCTYRPLRVNATVRHVSVWSALHWNHVSKHT